MSTTECCDITCTCCLLSLHPLFLVIGQRCQGVTFKKLRGLLDMGQHISLALLSLSHSHCTYHQKISTVTWRQTYTGLHTCPAALSSSSTSEIPKVTWSIRKSRLMQPFKVLIASKWDAMKMCIKQWNYLSTRKMFYHYLGSYFSVNIVLIVQMSSERPQTSSQNTRFNWRRQM